MSLLDGARGLAAADMAVDSTADYPFACYFCHGRADIPLDARTWVVEHRPDCPWLLMPKIVAALEAADDLAGLLEMVLADQVRNRWVSEDSPLLIEPRKVLEAWAALRSEG